MTRTVRIKIMDNRSAWLDVVINLSCPWTLHPLMSSNWWCAESAPISANKDGFDNLQTWNCTNKIVCSKLTSAGLFFPVYECVCVYESRVLPQNFVLGLKEGRRETFTSLKGWKSQCFIQLLSSPDFYLFLMLGSVKMEYSQSVMWFPSCCTIIDDFSSCQADDRFHHIICLFLCGNGQRLY